MAKKRGFLKITPPKLRISSKGVKVQAPRARVGKKVGLNISKSGVSGSVRTKAGTVNTKRGCTAKIPFLALLVVGVFSLVGLLGFISSPAGVNVPPAGAGLVPAWQVSFTPVATNFLPIVLKPVDTPTATATPTRTPTATATNTRTPTATATDSPFADVRIVRIEYDPAGSDAVGEYVDLKNFEFSAVDMNNWTLRDESNTVFSFPAFTLGAQATVRVWVRSGVNNSSNLYWGRDSATWNNDGDTAILRNAGGDQIDVCSYAGGGVSVSC